MNTQTTLLTTLSFVFYLGLWGCAPHANVGEFKGEKPFFDLESYFEEEIAKLNADQPALEKKVTYNGNPEIHTTTENDYAVELKLFKDSDINRTAWSDKYQIDTLREEDIVEGLVYTAVDSSLRVRKIRIDYEQGRIARIEIYKEQQSFVGQSRQTLSYTPGQGYAIASFQKAILAKAKDLKIETSFGR